MVLSIFFLAAKTDQCAAMQNKNVDVKTIVFFHRIFCNNLNCYYRVFVENPNVFTGYLQKFGVFHMIFMKTSSVFTGFSKTPSIFTWFS